MLAYILVSIFVATFILINVKILIKKKLRSCNEFTNASSYSSEGSENAGLWIILKSIAIMVLYSKKDPTHHETVYVKIYEQIFMQCSIKYSTLKTTFFGFSVVAPKSANLIRQFLSSKQCGNRVPEKFRWLLTGDESKGILFSNNDDTYKELHKYTVHTLAKLGFGKNTAMSVILDETLSDVLEHLEILRKDGGNKIQVHQLFSLSVSNIVWVMVGGKKFKQNDEKFLKLQNYVITGFSESGMAFLLGSAFPKFVLDIMQWFGMKCQSLAQLYRAGSEIFLEYIEEIELHGKSQGNSEEVENDFVNCFLSKIEKHKDDEKLSKIYSKNQLATLLVDLFSASLDTTNNYMESFIMHMVMYPNVQAKVFLEIEKVVGDTSPSYSAHSNRMPYTQAVVMEVHRTVNIVGVIGRATTNDLKLEGYTLKKDTVIGNMQAVINLDEAYWGDPKNFRPERFLDADNNILTEKVNYMIPFGAGVRKCPGENVAEATIFTLVVGILQRFTLVKSDKEEFVGLRKPMSPINGAEPFHVSVFLR